MDSLRNYGKTNWQQYDDGVWTGAEKGSIPGTGFNWPSGQVNTDMWGIGQPSMVGHEQCVRAMNKESSIPEPFFKLGDCDCSREFYYLCERN